MEISIIYPIKFEIRERTSDLTGKLVYQIVCVSNGGLDVPCNYQLKDGSWFNFTYSDKSEAEKELQLMNKEMQTEVNN